MSIVKINLTSEDWDKNLKGWKCDVIAISGAKVLKLCDLTGTEYPDAFYQISKEAKTLLWKNKDAQPQSVEMLIEWKDTSDELNRRWRKLAIILPIIAVIIGPILTLLINNWLSSEKEYSDSFGSLFGRQAYASFHDGYPATKDLEGKWEVHLFQYDSLGIKTPYKIGGKEYPAETAICKVEGSLIAFEGTHENGAKSYIWGEGRISSTGFITLIIWSDKDKFQRDIVSVNLLRLDLSNHPKEISLKGYRYAVDRNGNIEKGEVEYTKTNF